MGVIFALFTRRFRAWLLAAVLAPLVGRVLARIGATLEAQRGSTSVNRALISAGATLSNLRNDRRTGRGRGRLGRRSRR